MSVKILGGQAKGLSLVTPKTLLTRPTSVLLRRKLFDWRQSLEGEVFIDLCAGSGAMGLEAFSRGAQEVFLNDVLRLALEIIKTNVQKISQAMQKSPAQLKVTGLDALKWVKQELPLVTVQTQDIILYLDPPYEQHQLYRDVMLELRERGFAGEVWLESDRLKGPKRDELNQLFCSVIKTVEQGDHFVLVGKVV